MIVKAGFTAELETKKLPSTIYRLSNSCALQLVSNTDVAGSAPNRMVHFASRLLAEGNVDVAIQKILLHPERTEGTDLVEDRNDLAILAFDLKAHQEALAGRGVKPAVLYEGWGHTWRPHVEAKMVGFGRFGTSGHPAYWESALTEPVVHAGYTYCRNGTVGDRPALLSWVPLSVTIQELEQRMAESPDTNLSPFQALGKETAFLAQAGGQAIHIRPHAKQAASSMGDSGGPLFFNTKDGLQVAGIASGARFKTLIDPETKDSRLFQMDVYEPVMLHLEWIRGVLAGGPKSAGSQEAKHEAPVQATDSGPLPTVAPHGRDAIPARQAAGSPGAEAPGAIQPLAPGPAE